MQLVGGWQDIFLPWMLEDFVALRAAGRAPQLVIGPWTHVAPGLLAAGLKEGLAWLRAHLLGDRRMLADAPVRVYVTGERAGGGWRELPGWPPPGTGERRMWLAAEGRLLEGGLEPSGEHGDSYTYDPADPTPSLGGPVLLAREPVIDNRALEARADVLTYTTAPLGQTLEAIGPVRVELHVRASSPYFDLFARVCDVDPEGRSLNVCDALRRVKPADPEAERGRQHRGHVRAVADGPSLRGRAQGAPAGLLGRASPLRAQPGHGRGPPHRDRAARGARRGAARKRASVGARAPRLRGRDEARLRTRRVHPGGARRCGAPKSRPRSCS